eukprot:2003590-Lingulodinium_polyedra.AAC.1
MKTGGVAHNSGRASNNHSVFTLQGCVVPKPPTKHRKLANAGQRHLGNCAAHRRQTAVEALKGAPSKHAAQRHFVH